MYNIYNCRKVRGAKREVTAIQRLHLSSLFHRVPLFVLLFFYVFVFLFERVLSAFKCM